MPNLTRSHREGLTADTTSQRGSITIFFLLFVFVALGALSYSLYIGRTVQEKMRTTTAADTAALSMANHTAAGLNMIAVNNLAVAANLHTAAAIPFIGRYYAVARALMVSLSDGDDVLKALLDPIQADNSDFATGFHATHEMTALLTEAAAGNTRLNQLLVTTWFLQTVPHGITTARLNAPGSLPIPTRFLGLASEDHVGISRVQRLSQTSARQAMCHAVHASDGLAINRDSVVFWVRGLLRSTGIETGFLIPLEEFESFVQSIVATIDGKLGKVRDAVNATVGTIAGAACGLFPSDFGLSTVKRFFGKVTKRSSERKEVDSLCSFLDDLNKAFAVITNPPLPRFEDCGISHAGDFGQQMEAFAKDVVRADEIGFVFPATHSVADLAAFQASTQHGVLLAKPLFLKEELPTSKDGKSTQCPAEWLWQSPGGLKKCEALLHGIDFGSAQSARTTGQDAASGGIGVAASKVSGNKARLRSLLSRTQWILAEAKAEYRPQGDDPQSAATIALPPHDIEGQLNRTRMQLFWPAWRGRYAPPASLSAVLEYLGTP